MSNPAVAAFVKEENASRDRAQTKYAIFMTDPSLDFNDQLELEIKRAEKNNDEALTKPTWPEVMCDRVMNKHRLRWQQEAMAKGGAAVNTPPAPDASAVPAPAAPVEQVPPAGPITYTDAVGTFYVDGKAWKGTVHEYRSGKISITADVTGHKLAWVGVERLSPETRGWLGLGSAADGQAYQDAAQRAQAEQQRRAEAQKQLAEMQMKERHDREMEAIARQGWRRKLRTGLQRWNWRRRFASSDCGRMPRPVRRWT